MSRCCANKNRFEKRTISITDLFPHSCPCVGPSHFQPWSTSTGLFYLYFICQFAVSMPVGLGQESREFSRCRSQQLSNCAGSKQIGLHTKLLSKPSQFACDIFLAIQAKNNLLIPYRSSFTLFVILTEISYEETKKNL